MIKTLLLIMSLEGWSSVPYVDVAGNWTIGWGRVIEEPEKPTTKWREFYWMLSRVASDYRYVVEYGEACGYSWNSNQHRALTSFVYNLGPGALPQVTQDCTRSEAEIADKMLLYINAGGKPVQGLINRRQHERRIYDGTIY